MLYMNFSILLRLYAKKIEHENVRALLLVKKLMRLDITALIKVNKQKYINVIALAHS